MSNNLMRSLSHEGREAVLERLGLEPRRSAAAKVLPAVATFGAGLLLGAAVGILLGAGAGRPRRPGASEDDPASGHS